VERNALRAGLVKRAQDWRWSSLRRRSRGPSGGAADGMAHRSARRLDPAGESAWQAEQGGELSLIGT